jgi:hypothetical protein
MHVDMAGHAGSSGFAQIHSQIDTVGMIKLAHDPFQALGKGHHLFGGGHGKFLQLVHMLIRHNHGMARSVRKSVQDHKAMFGAMNNQRFFIVFCLYKAAKYAVTGVICGGYVGITPGGKKKVHDLKKDIRRIRVLSNFTAFERLTVSWAVVIVEGVLWPFQDCRKIRPLVFEPSA